MQEMASFARWRRDLLSNSEEAALQPKSKFVSSLRERADLIALRTERRERK